jgi:hypothetical protein
LARHRLTGSILDVLLHLCSQYSEMGTIPEDFSLLDCSILLFSDIDMSIFEALKSMYFYSRGYSPPGVLVALVSRKEYRRNQRDLGMHLARTQCFMKTGAMTPSGGTAVRAEPVISASGARIFGLTTKMLGSTLSMAHAIGYIIR